MQMTPRLPALFEMPLLNVFGRIKWKLLKRSVFRQSKYKQEAAFRYKQSGTRTFAFRCRVRITIGEKSICTPHFYFCDILSWKAVCLFFFYSGWYFVHFWPSVLHNGMHGNGATQLWRWPKILLCRKFPRSLRGEVDVLQMINETSQHQTPPHLVASHQTKPDTCCFWSRSFVESQGAKMICRKKTCVQRALRVLSLLLWVCIFQELPSTSWLFHFPLSAIQFIEIPVFNLKVFFYLKCCAFNNVMLMSCLQTLVNQKWGNHSNYVTICHVTPEVTWYVTCPSLQHAILNTFLASLSQFNILY